MNSTLQNTSLKRILFYVLIGIVISKAISPMFNNLSQGSIYSNNGLMSRGNNQNMYTQQGQYYGNTNFGNRMSVNSNYNSPNPYESYNDNWSKNQQIQSGQIDAFSDYLLDQEKVVTGDGSIYSVESGYNQTMINPYSQEMIQTNDVLATPQQYGSGYEVATPYNYSTGSADGDGQ